MADTPSNSIAIGTKAADFKLFDTVSGTELSLSDIQGKKGTVIMFICNHCPFVKHVDDELVRLAEDYQQKDIGFAAISSNDVENYPQDRPELMKETAEKIGYPFPYLYDETQKVAHQYDAACTPDFYLFDENSALFYHGQLDNSRPKNENPLTGKDLREALDLLLEKKQPPTSQKPSIGCGIKWKKHHQ